MCEPLGYMLGKGQRTIKYPSPHNLIYELSWILEWGRNEQVGHDSCFSFKLNLNWLLVKNYLNDLDGLYLIESRG